MFFGLGIDLPRNLEEPRLVCRLEKAQYAHWMAAVVESRQEAHYLRQETVEDELEMMNFEAVLVAEVERPWRPTVSVEE